MTKEIVVTQGRVVLVDDDDYDELSKYKWSVNQNGYVGRYNPEKYALYKTHTKYMMHRVVMNAPDGVLVDHINGNKFDNRKSNLRLCNKSQNRANSGIDKSNTSGFKGVFWDKANKRWVANISMGEKRVWSKYCRNIEDAVAAYDEHAKIFFGEFAKTNADIKGGV